MKKIIHYKLGREERERLVERITGVLINKHGIVFSYIYGSFLDSKPFRDIDIAIFIDEKEVRNSFLFESDIAERLKQELNVDFPMDVRIINQSPITFKYNMIRGRLIVNHNEGIRTDFFVHTVSRYLDLKPILHHHQREAFAH
jgi:predicted nucleotidyltransferase